MFISFAFVDAHTLDVYYSATTRFGRFKGFYIITPGRFEGINIDCVSKGIS